MAYIFSVQSYCCGTPLSPNSSHPIGLAQRTAPPKVRIRLWPVMHGHKYLDSCATRSVITVITAMRWTLTGYINETMLAVVVVLKYQATTTTYIQASWRRRCGQREAGRQRIRAEEDRRMGDKKRRSSNACGSRSMRRAGRPSKRRPRRRSWRRPRRGRAVGGASPGARGLAGRSAGGGSKTTACSRLPSSAAWRRSGRTKLPAGSHASSSGSTLGSAAAGYRGGDPARD